MLQAYAPGAVIDEGLLSFTVPLAGGSDGNHVGEMAAAAAMLAELQIAGVQATAFAWQPPSLEEVFVAMIGATKKEEAA